LIYVFYGTNSKSSYLEVFPSYNTDR